nr:uncharacterized protein LOC123772046 [Procambarus clarkii]
MVKEICEEFNATSHGVFTIEPEQFPELDWEAAADEKLLHIVVTAEEVRIQLASLDENKATGPDRIFPWMFKEAAHALSIPLALICNESLTQEELPYCWKKTNVVQIFRRGDSEAALSYIPVALTSIPCKKKQRRQDLRRSVDSESVTNESDKRKKCDAETDQTSVDERAEQCQEGDCQQRWRLLFPTSCTLTYHKKLLWTVNLGREHCKFEPLLNEGVNRRYFT